MKIVMTVKEAMRACRQPLSPPAMEAVADELLGHNSPGRKRSREYPTLSEVQYGRRIAREVLLGGYQINSMVDTDTGLLVEVPVAYKRRPCRRQIERDYSSPYMGGYSA